MPKFSPQRGLKSGTPRYTHVFENFGWIILSDAYGNRQKIEIYKISLVQLKDQIIKKFLKSKT
jgi:hypothetical protein